MLPTELGYGSGSTCWRRFRAWTQSGVGPKLHQRLVRRLVRSPLAPYGRARKEHGSGLGNTDPRKILHPLLSDLAIGQDEATRDLPESLIDARHRSRQPGTPPRTGSSHPPETSLATGP